MVGVAKPNQEPCKCVRVCLEPRNGRTETFPFPSHYIMFILIDASYLAVLDL